MWVLLAVIYIPDILPFGKYSYYSNTQETTTSEEPGTTELGSDSDDLSVGVAAYGYGSSVSCASAPGLQHAGQGAVTSEHDNHRIGHNATLANEADTNSEVDTKVDQAESLPSVIDSASASESLDNSEAATPPTVGEVISSRRIERSEWITWQPRMTRSMTNAAASSSAQASTSAAGPSTSPQGQKRKSTDTDEDEDLPWQHEFRDEEDAYEEDEERHLRDTATAGPDGRWSCPAPNCGKLVSSLEIMIRHWKGCKKRPDPQSIPCPGCGKLFTRGDAMRRHHRNPNACEGYVADDEVRSKRGRGPKRGRGGGGGRKRARRG
ncbi:hypothetical protein IEO21_08360 [Rhodonia placenta]|uniref:C2H2-type domain-containing protein n=1 Tax=Rhodonia placenta TaxID=104341 RepID=A0A8H7NWB5_9APHY|nr:hypothetical protein IEO21_08360 [Postia placenta]